MKKLLALFLLLVAPYLSAQELSPLSPYFSNNSLLEGTKELRNLQKYLAEKQEEIKPGLEFNLEDVLIKKFDEEIRKIKPPEIKVQNNAPVYKFILENNELFETDTLFTSDTIDIVSIIYSKILNIAYKKIDTLQYILGENVAISKTIRLLLAQAIEYISTYLEAYLSGGEIAKELKDNKYAQKFNRILHDIKQSASNDLRKLMESESTDIVMEKKLEKVINKYFDNKINDLKTTVKEQVEDIITSYKKDLINGANAFFLAGNMGLSFSQGSADFGGGLLIGYKWTDMFSVSAFTNTLLNRNDKNDTINTFWGLNTKIKFSDIQLDLIGSKYFGKGTNEIYEFAAGASYNLLNAIIIGVLYSRYRNDGDITPSSVKVRNDWGLTFKYPDKNSPTLYLGIFNENQNNAFAFKEAIKNFGAKLIYPINPQF